MSGAYSNNNLLYGRKCQFVTFDGTADASVALDKTTEAVTLYATAACWVLVGTAPTAAKPSAEKVRVDSLYLPASVPFDYAVPKGTDAAPMKVSVIQDSSGGNCYIYERSSV